MGVEIGPVSDWLVSVEGKSDNIERIEEIDMSGVSPRCGCGE